MEITREQSRNWIGDVCRAGVLGMLANGFGSSPRVQASSGMDFGQRCSAWLDSLDDERRLDARNARGRELPCWMVQSLRAADIPVVAAEVRQSPPRRVFLMPTILADIIEALSDIPE